MAAERLCVKADGVPVGAAHREWTLREDNSAHHHGVVNLSESPLYVTLQRRESTGDPAVLVGTFRFDLDGLLQGGFIRRENNGRPGSVRLRIVRAQDGGFYVQVRRDSPRLPLAE